MLYKYIFIIVRIRETIETFLLKCVDVLKIHKNNDHFNGCISVYSERNTILRQKKRFATSLDPKGQGKVTRVFSYSVKI